MSSNQDINNCEKTPIGDVFGAVRERVLHRVAVLGFDLVLLMAMALLLVVSVFALGGNVRLYQASVLLPMFCMGLTLVLKAWREPWKWREDIRRILRDWVPFLFVVFIYENLHDVAGQVTTFDFAVPLNRWDIAIFGIEPTIWVQKFFTPIATDLLSVSYGLYFALPLFLMLLLSLWDRRFDVRHVALCLSLVFMMGFVGYVFLPASPPRYFIEHLYTDPPRLYGLFLFNRLQGAWDGLSVISGGAFPSLHVGISTVALIYAWRYRNLNRMFRILLYAYIPLAISLWFSTVYLRHHWVIDIVAGWLVAWAAYLLANPMMNAWVNLRKRYELPF